MCSAPISLRVDWCTPRGSATARMPRPAQGQPQKKQLLLSISSPKNPVISHSQIFEGIQSSQSQTLPGHTEQLSAPLPAVARPGHHAHGRRKVPSPPWFLCLALFGKTSETSYARTCFRNLDSSWTLDAFCWMVKTDKFLIEYSRGSICASTILYMLVQ